MSQGVTNRRIAFLAIALGVGGIIFANHSDWSVTRQIGLMLILYFVFFICLFLYFKIKDARKSRDQS
ncbi:MAG: hypothetical protein AAF362_03465 [Pseudomonadota bacterium]